MKKIVLSLVFLTLIFSVMGQSADKKIRFEIETSFGTMKGVLYNETPLHRDNFVKLVKEGWYENSPFHRIIKNFMIQGGQNADGRLDPDYKIPAEIKPQFFHKKGALAAARMGDQVNPKKESSGSQFYIVQGEILPAEAIAYYKNHGIKFTPESEKLYQTVPGTPHLDGEYTVFGEITEGLDIIDKIAGVKTGYGDVPVEKVTMKIKILD